MRHTCFDQRLLPGAARRAVSQVCRAASTGPVCEESTVLATSEVVTNALVHGRGPVDVGIEAGCRLVRIEVGDDEPRHPTGSRSESARTVAAETDEGGRGLLIVAALTSAWGVMDRVGGGKYVWFEIPAHP